MRREGAGNPAGQHGGAGGVHGRHGGGDGAEHRAGGNVRESGLLEPAKGYLGKTGVFWQAGNCQPDCTLTIEYQYGDILVHMLSGQCRISLRTQRI